MEELTGQVERITFRNEDNGYSVLRVKADGHGIDRITVTVSSPQIIVGSEMVFKGQWEFHNQFGRQFKAEESNELLPTSLQGMKKFLGSGLIKGIGPQTAKKIVQKFGLKTFEVLEKEPEKLLEIKGITNKKLKSVEKSWLKYQGTKQVLTFLKEHNLPTGLALKLVESFGSKAVEILKENPYQLIRKVRGLGFITVDQMAMNLGFTKDCDKRVMAGILETLYSARNDGHLYLLKADLLYKCSELLELSLNEKVEKLLDQLIKEESIVLDGDRFYTKSSFEAECRVAKKILQLKSQVVEDQRDLCRDWIQNFCTKENIQLSDQQAKAVIGIAHQGFSVLTGGPGVGKTTTTRVLFYLLKAMKLNIVLAAPTGRAAQRMSEVIGHEAKTIHRLLNFNPQKGGFEYHEDNPIDCDFLIADECSMLDNSLTDSLLKACDEHTQVLFIGDPDQLPSVGPGNILQDILHSRVVPTFELTQVFRQGKGSKIIDYAHAINRGVLPKIKNPFEHPEIWKPETFEDAMLLESDEFTKEQIELIQRIKTSRTPIDLIDKFKHIDQETIKKEENKTKLLRLLQKSISSHHSLQFNLTATELIKRLYLEIIPRYLKNAEIQILSPMKNGPLGTIALNKMIQDCINPKKSIEVKGFRPGDRVIQTRNNYDLGVFNGDIGKIIDIDEDDEFLEIDFSTKTDKDRIITYPLEDMMDLNLAYAITIHKSQGSEFDVVLLPITMSHFTMLYRNLIYTGLTRAKKLALFIGNKRAMLMGVKNQNPTQRFTSLRERLNSN